MYYEISVKCNQLDALFIFSVFSYYTSTCFGLLVAYHQEVTGNRGKNWYLYFSVD
jgi:hypothetical protein